MESTLDQGIKHEDGKYTCESCGQWQYDSVRKLGKIVHSRSCQTPDAQYGHFRKVEPAPAARQSREPREIEDENDFMEVRDVCGDERGY